MATAPTPSISAPSGIYSSVSGLTSGVIELSGVGYGCIITSPGKYSVFVTTCGSVISILVAGGFTPRSVAQLVSTADDNTAVIISVVCIA